MVELGNENYCHHFVKGRSIHVDVGPNGQHEACDSFVNPEPLLTAFEREWQSGRALRDTIHIMNKMMNVILNLSQKSDLTIRCSIILPRRDEQCSQ